MLSYLYVIRSAELERKPKAPIRHQVEQLRQDQQISPDILLKAPYILDFLYIKGLPKNK
jgi:predicted nuclease of restriction endonuclease-like (RecB) superfamily